MIKKIILLLLLLSNVIFGYEKTEDALYIFNNDELVEMFGPNPACQLSATAIFNEGIIKYKLQKTGNFKGAVERSGKFIETVDRVFVREMEDWHSWKESYKNLVSFYTKNCPKTLKKTAKNILPYEDYKIMGRLNMTKWFKGERKGRMDRYGNFWQTKCRWDPAYTRWDGTKVMKEVCWEVKEEDI